MSSSDSGGSIAGSPHDVGFGAGINEDNFITLFSSNGAEVTVRESEADKLLSIGFRRVKLDIEAQLSEVMVGFDSAKQAMRDVVRSVTSDGVIDAIDNHAYVAYQEAIKQLSDKSQQLFNDLHTLYPMAQGTGVQMVTNKFFENGDVVITEVDSGQVELYETEHGWKRA